MVQFAVFLLLVFSSPLSHGYHIVIDPGHGGSDRGATNRSTNESELTLKMTHKLVRGLRNKGFKVTLTRKGNQNLSLQARVEIANSVKADLLVSIHANSSVDKRAKGAEFYFQNQLDADEESMFLASRENQNSKPALINSDDKHSSTIDHILGDMKRTYNIYLSSELSKKLALNWKGQKKSKLNLIKQAPFYVIKNSNMPSVLVELGYLSHNFESKKLTQSKYQNIMVSSIIKAIVDYKKQIDNN